jgi:uncharacterized membrane protein YhaH (DUF805 family)
MKEKIKNYLKILSTGRLSRKNHLLSYLIILAIYLFSLLLLFRIPDIFGKTIISGIIGLLIILFQFFLLIFHVSLIIRRSHDFNLHGFWGVILGLFIPFGFLYILFKKGDAEANKYGNPPEHKFNFFKIILNK